MNDSALTTAMREYLRGEKEVSDSYERNLINDIRNRLAFGLGDLALAAEYIDKIDPAKVLMRFQEGQPADGDPSDGRVGWRQHDARESIIGALTFLIEVSRAFDYGSPNWERWLKQAIRETSNVEHVRVSIDAYSSQQLDELESKGLGEINKTELTALLDSGRVSINDVYEAGREIPHRQIPHTEHDPLRDS